ncbi:Ketohexokinase [Achaetomium macrosporum]|uniref:Ketohexokinase n=1 Tax=Achaetomium macrosporum TaxID=79813 RepID=A0AAN7C1Y1_9PEZI|nr:Ketohexokinase [Achaetomium macrosporum]
MSEKRDPSRFLNPSNLTLPSTPSASNEAAYQTRENETLAAANSTTAPSSSSSSPDSYPAPLTTENIHLTPREIALKRTISAQERLETAHEGWLLVAQALVRSGIIPGDEAISRGMSEFGHAMCGRYAAAFFLAGALEDMAPEDWFAKERQKWAATLRKLETLKGLEGSLVCWERVVLELVDLVDERNNSPRKDEWDYEEEWCGKVRKVLRRWRRGVPRRP